MRIRDPEVSIIIPTRNRHERLPRTLAGALAQEAVVAETILVDDGSSPPIAPLLGDQAQEQVRVLRNEEPGGVSAARNAGIAAARGPWLAFLDDDDLWAPTKLRRTLDAAIEENADFAFSGGVAIDGRGLVAFADDGPPEGTSLYEALLAANILPFGASNLVVKTALVRSLGGFDPELSIFADWDFNIRLSAAGRSAIVRDRLVAWVLHETNIHSEDALIADEVSYLAGKHAAARAARGVSLDKQRLLQLRTGTRRRLGDRRGAARGYWQLGVLSRNPKMLVRGAAMWLGGERAMNIARRLRPVRDHPPPLPAPRWLEPALSPTQGVLRAVWR